MRRLSIIAGICLLTSYAHSDPAPLEQMRLRATVRPSADLSVTANSMFNPRFFDAKIYANQINANCACFGRYPVGSSIPEMLVNNTFNTPLEHRMVAPFRGAYRTTYLLGSSSAASATTTFTRYDFDGNNPVTIDSPDALCVDGFDWVDDDTIIYAIYTSGSRNKLYLADVVAEPFAVTKNTSWNGAGYITTSVTTRIRNVRRGDLYKGFAYYGDAGQNNNPKFFALNLTNGVETALGNAGTLTGTGSFGVWTVLERGGYLYVQTTDNGVSIYSLANATTLGPLVASYTKAQLDALTGGSAQYFGLDVTPDGQKWLLGGLSGKVYQLGVRLVPYLAEQLQPRVTVQPNVDLGIGANSMFNARFFDDKIYANQVNANSACFGRYPSGTNTPEMLVNNSANSALEHRMVAPFRGSLHSTYILGSSSAAAATATFTRYDFDGNNPVTTDSPDALVVDAFDWVDDDTIIYAIYTSGSRNKLYLADVLAEPFTVYKNTTWNADGYVTTSVTTRIRNVRTGDMYSGYAYYGDAGQNSNPKFYALDLTNGVETLLGSAGTLTGSGSFGVWTVLERDGYLYVQTTDNGVQIYTMTNATTLGPLFTTYTKAQLDALTGGSAQYFGLDVVPDGRKLLLSALAGKVFELEGRPSLTLSLAGRNAQLSWSALVSPMILQSSSDLSAGFLDLDPQPAVIIDGEAKTASVPLPVGANKLFFRLRK